MLQRMQWLRVVVVLEEGIAGRGSPSVVVVSGSESEHRIVAVSGRSSEGFLRGGGLALALQTSLESSSVFLLCGGESFGGGQLGLSAERVLQECDSEGADVSLKQRLSWIRLPTLFLSVQLDLLAGSLLKFHTAMGSFLL